MRRKYFLTVPEYAKNTHFSERHVRRLIKEGKIQAKKVGRKWIILADQTKDLKIHYHYCTPGIKVPIPPIPPDGLIWDNDEKGFVPIEKYAKKHGLPIKVVNGKKCVFYKPTIDEIKNAILFQSQ